MNQTNAWLVEVGIIISNLLKELERIDTEPADLRGLLMSHVKLEAIHEEFAALFEGFGTHEPEMAKAEQIAVERLNLVSDVLHRIENTPTMRSAVRQRLRELLGASRQPDELVAVYAARHVYRDDGDIYRIYLRQNLVTGDLRPRGVARIPAGTVHVFSERLDAVCQRIDTHADPDRLECALSLWEPYDEDSVFYDLNEALKAAHVLV